MALVGALTLTSGGRAQPAPSEPAPAPAPAPEAPRWVTLRVGVLPVPSYALSRDDPFKESATAARVREAAGRWQRRLEATLEALDQVEVVGAATLHGRAARRRGYSEARVLSAERLQLAVEAYRALDGAQALTHLGRAEALQRQVQAALVDPREAADVAFYRGLVHIERGETSRAHIAFREVFRLDPARSFDRGYYPPAVEEALAAAIDDLVAQPDPLGFRYPFDALAALAAQVGVDVWVGALVAGPVDAPVLRWFVHDVRSRATPVSARAALSDPDRVVEHVGRSLSAWHTCALAEREPAEPDPRGPGGDLWDQIAVDVSYLHGLYLQHDRVREPFHLLGAQLGVTWRVAPPLELAFRLSHVGAVPDGNGDLVEPFTQSRIHVGVGLSGGPKDVHVFARIGPELAVFVNDFAVTTDVDCKHFGASHPRCSGLPRIVAPTALFGVRFAAGARMRFAGRWFVTASVAVTSYIPTDDVSPGLNFPFEATLGLGAGL